MGHMLLKMAINATHPGTVNVFKMLGDFFFWCDLVALFLSMNFVDDNIMPKCQKVKSILSVLWLLLCYVKEVFLWLFVEAFRLPFTILLFPA